VAKAFTFEIKGLKELQKKFDVMPKQLVEEIDGELESSCQNIVLGAKRDVPKRGGGGGGISSGISFSGINLSYIIVSTKYYSPYQEFGTGKYVFYGQNYVVGAVETYAGQFRGKGVKKINIYPQPFFFSNFFLERPKLLKNISDVIKRIEQS